LLILSGGLFGLGAKTLQNENYSRHMEIAEGITNTCHESYIRSNTKLGPESFRFSDAIEAKVGAVQYLIYNRQFYLNKN